MDTVNWLPRNDHTQNWDEHRINAVIWRIQWNDYWNSYNNSTFMYIYLHVYNDSIYNIKWNDYHTLSAETHHNQLLVCQIVFHAHK